MAKAKKPFDQERVLELWEKGKTIKQIAEAVGCSRVYAHRLLSTKFKAQYQAGVKARRDAREKAKDGGK
jgi:DNA-binding NarL/FixJ family response regulator